MAPLVSVIIPCFNGERFLREAVESALSQSYADLEVIVVDDGSADKSHEIIAALCDRDRRLKYLRQANQGVSAARNHGYQVSTGEYVAFLDCDDVWLPDNISSKMQKFGSGSFGLVHSDSMVIDEASRPTGAVMLGQEGQVLDKLLAWEETVIPGPSSILVPRKVLDEVGGFDINLSTSADQDLFFRIAAKHVIGRVPLVTSSYRVHDGNMHKNIRRMEKDVLYVFKKAAQSGAFKSPSFQRRCFSSMYLILAASWAGDGANRVKGFLFLLRALTTHPSAWLKVYRKLMSYV